MSLVVNNNLMAANVARNLNTHYGRLQTSTQRLSSGLRINSAADDAAGLAIRELQRADIAALHQGARNANDAISMIQVADGALGVIDEKLIRMKELAEQAATGTYSSTQRLMIESEYQAMASEITRIANATDFNGIKLLDGTLSGAHDGSGRGVKLDGTVDGLSSTGKLKVHFGTANDSAEDYYYVTIGNCTAGALGVGNSAYVVEDKKYFVSSTKMTLSDGTEVEKAADTDFVKTTTSTVSAFTTPADLVQVWEDPAGNQFYNNNGVITPMPGITATPPADLTGLTEVKTASGNKVLVDINTPADTYWKPEYKTAAGVGVNQDATVTTTTTTTEVEKKPAFVDANGKAIDPQPGNMVEVFEDAANVKFYKASDGNFYRTDATPTTVFTPTGNPPFKQAEGDYGPLFVEQTDAAPAAALTEIAQAEYFDPKTGTYLKADVEVQETGGGKVPADGFTVSTQEAAQKALEAINLAIESKDKIRAHLGAMQNRLENTVTNLNVQAENLQAAESRISDVDVATEMTQFVRNQILTQSAVAMLGQANSLPQMAMQLIGG